MSSSTSISPTSTDLELVEAVRINPRDQRAWRAIITRVEAPLRLRVRELMGESAKREDVDDAVAYAVVEFYRRLLIAKMEVFYGTDRKLPVSLPAFAKKAGAETGIRKLRRLQYGPGYETIVVPGLKLKSLIANERLSIEEAAKRQDITVDRANYLIFELDAVPTPLAPVALAEVDTRRGRSAEEAYENTPAAMLDTIAPLVKTPEARAYLVRLAGSRESIGEGVEGGANVQSALDIAHNDYERLRKRARRDAMAAVGVSNLQDLAKRRESVAAILRGEVSA